MITPVGMVFGIVLLIGGGTLLVRGASEVAARLGVSPLVVGLTVVGFGTSAPELVVNVVGVMRGATGLAFGNVVGSNIFNSLFVLPTSGMISQIPIPHGGISDLVMSLLMAALLIPIFIFGEARMGRKTGGFLLVAYAAYVIGRVVYDKS